MRTFGGIFAIFSFISLQIEAAPLLDTYINRAKVRLSECTFDSDGRPVFRTSEPLPTQLQPNDEVYVMPADSLSDGASLEIALFYQQDGNWIQSTIFSSRALRLQLPVLVQIPDIACTDCFLVSTIVPEVGDPTSPAEPGIIRTSAPVVIGNSGDGGSPDNQVGGGLPPNNGNTGGVTHDLNLTTIGFSGASGCGFIEETSTSTFAGIQILTFVFALFLLRRTLRKI